jgi:flagellar basal-body rod protein FlgG
MPITSLLTSNTGLQAASTFLDVVGNNVANSSTPGYKTAQTRFQDLLYTGLKPGAISTPGITPPGGTQIGTGTLIDDVAGLFTQGGLTMTGVPLDVAVTGEGFFAVTLADGTTGYTRAGNFTTDATGQIVTSEGFRLAGGLVVPPGTSSVSISAAGVVSATTAAGVVQVGNITLTRFQNPSGLLRIGNTTFTAGPGSGTATTGTPGTNGFGTLSQGFLEQSNVELTTELINLLIAQRTFSFNSQAIQIENEVLQATTALIQ